MIRLKPTLLQLLICVYAPLENNNVFYEQLDKAYSIIRDLDTKLITDYFN